MAFVLAALTVLGSVLVAVPRASGGLTDFTVLRSQYTMAYLYVPEEVITITITGDTAGEPFDIAVYIPSSRQVLKPFENVTILSAGASVTVTWQVAATLPDGTDYAVGVRDGNWIVGGTVGPAPPFGFQQIAIQAYRLRVEVNRPAYVGGDTVIVTWSANNIKGGGLAPNGYAQLWVYDTSAACCAGTLISPSVFTTNQSSGIFSFPLREPSDPAFDGLVEMWFNETTSNSKRSQWAGASFYIDDLAVRVAASPGQTAPSGIVTATVTTVTSPNRFPQCPSGCAEPGMKVVVSVWHTPSTPPAVEQTQYGATGLTTDAHGVLAYVFKLDATAPASVTGERYEVRVNASTPSDILSRTAIATFTVSTAAVIAQVLQLDKTEYQAGDTATVTSAVTGAGTATLTYVFEVRDASTVGCFVGTNAPLLAKATQSANKYSYRIPQDFSSLTGTLCFLVAADNGQGTSVTTPISARVVFGWLLLNADQREYNPGDVVTISWDLVSNRITTPSYFYEVRDQNNNLVTSGGTDARESFQFTVPDPASTRYRFTVTATQSGRSVSQSIDLTLAAGFFLTATFDRSSYAPGDTVRFHYRIAARSASSIPPATYRITYGLLNGGPQQVTATGSAEGDLTYVVPRGVDEGDQIFQVLEASTGAGMLETLTIRGTSPFWFVSVGDIPILVLIMLIWLILMTLMLWRKGVFGGMGMKAPKEAPPPPAKQGPVYAPPTSPMTVTCRSCSSPIEITTSKRPIEVMCPKCGNTEVVS